MKEKAKSTGFSRE